MNIMTGFTQISTEHNNHIIIMIILGLNSKNFECKIRIYIYNIYYKKFL